MGTPQAPWPLLWAVLQLGCWPGWLLGRWAWAGWCGSGPGLPFTVSSRWDWAPEAQHGPWQGAVWPRTSEGPSLGSDCSPAVLARGKPVLAQGGPHPC